MTTGARADDFDPDAGRLAVVTDERDEDGDGIAEVDLAEYVGAINADLTVGADVTEAEPLEANADLSNRGVELGRAWLHRDAGGGRVPWPRARRRTRRTHPALPERARHHTVPARVLVIDLFGLEARRGPRADSRRSTNTLLREVKPAARRTAAGCFRDNWWLLRRATSRCPGGPRRSPATSPLRTSRSTVCSCSSTAHVLPDKRLVAIASADAYHLGVLSSQVHIEWALAAGGRLG